MLKVVEAICAGLSTLSNKRMRNILSLCGHQPMNWNFKYNILVIDETITHEKQFLKADDG